METKLSMTPLHQITDELLTVREITLYVKRDELIHPYLQGNKWRKLKYNIEEARKQGKQTLLTFGGAYSNHIYATAAAAKEFNFNAIGIISGKEPSCYSSTLQFAQQQGMKLHFISREQYRQKYIPAFIQHLCHLYGDFYLVPEGGTNTFALKGVAEIIEELPADYDYLCATCGTGGTIAGLVAGLKGEKQVLGFSSLKGEDTLTPIVYSLVKEYCGQQFDNFTINFDYHFGGYAKVKPELTGFISRFEQQHHIFLEQVYTGKMLYGLFDLVSKGYFPKGSRIIALHTGGLQGKNK